MKERIGKLEEGERKEDNVIQGRTGGNKIIDKVGELERRLDTREREERRRNVVIRDVEVKEGGRRKAVEEILGIVGAKVEVGEVKRIGEVKEKGRKMLLVRLGSEEQKWEVMEKKKNLRGRKERILEDLSWRERRVRWRLGEIARMEEAKGRRVWVRGGRIRIGDQWWRWNDEGEVLRDERGEIRGEIQGEGR